MIALPILGLPAGLRAEPGAAPNGRPTPDRWDQWQPQTDTKDTRLVSSRLTLWHKEVTLADLLLEASDSTGVSLAAIDELAPLRVSAFAEHGSLDGVMVSLADLFRGYWAFRRGDSPLRRSYCLTTYERADAPFDIWAEEWSRWYALANASRHRAARDARLSLYQVALRLPASEMVDRYGETDPWLCADLLSRITRPMLEFVTSLPPRQREQLLAEGRLAVRLRDLEPDLRDYLGRWCKGEWGPSAGGFAAPDPDRLARFARPEDRWLHSTVMLYWTHRNLTLRLDVPDVGFFDNEVVRLATTDTVASVCQWLASHGYLEDTPERRARLRQRLTDGGPATSPPPQGKEPSLPSLTPRPDETDPRLHTPVTMEGWPAGGLSVADYLEQAAVQLHLAIVAPYLPLESVSVHWTGGSAGEGSHDSEGVARETEAASEPAPPPPSRGPTLGEVLSQIRSDRGDLLSWRFRGDNLVVVDAEHRLMEGSRLPTESLAEWRERLQSGAVLPLDEFASFLVGLNEWQLYTLQSTFMSYELMLSMPLEAVRLWGLLGKPRQQRASAEGVRLSELAEEQKRGYQRIARRSHPWLQSSDLSNAVLRTIPRKLSTGQDGITFIIEYHFPDSPNDRDVLFTLPLEITVPESPQ